MSDDADTGLEALQSMLDNRNLPPVHSWNPLVCRDIDMRIARNGDWFYKGSVISRKRMVKLFSTVLRVDDDGHTYLVTPHEKLKISVEDAPFTAVLLHTEGQAEKANLFFTTNVGMLCWQGLNARLSFTIESRAVNPRLMCWSGINYKRSYPAPYSFSWLNWQLKKTVIMVFTVIIALCHLAAAPMTAGIEP